MEIIFKKLESFILPVDRKPVVKDLAVFTEGIWHDRAVVITGEPVMEEILKPHELYVVSDQKIKEGDKVVFEKRRVLTVKKVLGNYLSVYEHNNDIPVDDCQVIVVSSDKTITGTIANIARTSDEFINRLWDNINKIPRELMTIEVGYEKNCICNPMCEFPSAFGNCSHKNNRKEVLYNNDGVAHLRDVEIMTKIM